jgi:hypothetical protein
MTPFALSLYSSLPSSLEESLAARQLGTRLTATTASSGLAGQLTVMTTEGDTVTLNATLVQNFEVFNYHRTARHASVTLDMRAKETQYVLEQKLGMTVEGDLNEQEVRDLLTLFEKVLDLFRKFVRGQDEAAFTTMATLARRFDTFSTLSSLDLTMMAERSLMMLTASESPAGSEHVLAPVTIPSQTTVRATTRALSSTTTTALFPQDSEASAEHSVSSGPTDERKDIRLTGLFSLDKRSLALVDQLRETVKQSSVDPDTLRKFLPRLLQHAREEVGAELNRETITK